MMFFSGSQETEFLCGERINFPDAERVGNFFPFFSTPIPEIETCDFLSLYPEEKAGRSLSAASP